MLLISAIDIISIFKCVTYYSVCPCEYRRCRSPTPTILSSAWNAVWNLLSAHRWLGTTFLKKLLSFNQVFCVFSNPYFFFFHPGHGLISPPPLELNSIPFIFNVSSFECLFTKKCFTFWFRCAPPLALHPMHSCTLHISWAGICLNKYKSTSSMEI